MTEYVNRKSKIGGDGERTDKGFTLVEILIAIVLIGILSAVVVVGISNLTSKGNKSACQASADAAKAGAIVYYATSATSAYPATFNDMTAGASPALVLPTGVTVNSAASVVPAQPTGVAAGLQASNGSWYLTMVPGSATVAPTFSCLP